MQNLPFLLQKKETEITFNGVKTQFLHTCPEAYKLFKKSIDELDLSPQAITSDIDDKSEVYSNNKPDRIRRAQTKHYLNI